MTSLSSSRCRSAEGSEQDAAGFRLHHPGHHHPHALTSTEVFVLHQKRLDSLDQIRDETLRIALGGKTVDTRELSAHQIGHHDESAGRADIDGHHASLA